LMTVNPGFGGQTFIPEVLPKISAVRELLRTRGLKAELQVDGGINPDTAAMVVKAGANVLVAGAAVFTGGDVSGNLQQLRQAAEKGL